MAVSFIGGGNRSARGKPLTCRKSLTNLKEKTITNIYVMLNLGF
jgi:hypothetical protein